MWHLRLIIPIERWVGAQERSVLRRGHVTNDSRPCYQDFRCAWLRTWLSQSFCRAAQLLKVGLCKEKAEEFFGFSFLFFQPFSEKTQILNIASSLGVARWLDAKVEVTLTNSCWNRITTIGKLRSLGVQALLSSAQKTVSMSTKAASMLLVVDPELSTRS